MIYEFKDSGSASAINYNNSESGLQATKVQSAIDETVSKFGGLRIGTDSVTGKPGYWKKEAGTEVFVPFSSGANFTSVEYLGTGREIEYAGSKTVNVSVGDWIIFFTNSTSYSYPFIVSVTNCELLLSYENTRAIIRVYKATDTSVNIKTGDYPYGYVFALKQ